MHFFQKKKRDRFGCPLKFIIPDRNDKNGIAVFCISLIAKFILERFLICMAFDDFSSRLLLTIQQQFEPIQCNPSGRAFYNRNIYYFVIFIVFSLQKYFLSRRDYRVSLFH